MNLEFSLLRMEHNDTETMGVLLFERKLLCFTLEPPWRGNRVNESCIPLGTYSMRRRSSQRHGDCLEVLNVPGRSDILVHPGNVVRDTDGCILPGLEIGYLGSKRAVLRSRRAMEEIRKALAVESNALILRVRKGRHELAFAGGIDWR